MVTMKANEKLEFATRMNTVADMLGVPPKGANRQQIFGKMFDASRVLQTLGYIAHDQIDTHALGADHDRNVRHFDFDLSVPAAS